MVQARQASSTRCTACHRNKPPKVGRVAIYVRVSSPDQKAELDRQVARLVSWATERGLTVSKVVQEIGSGLNGNRRKWMRLLSDPDGTLIIVEHRDRLARFGFIQSALQAQRRQVLVVEPGEVADDIVRDLHEVVFSLCARLYDKRSAKHRAKRAVRVATTDADCDGT